jgi:hypothetical protein
MEYTPMPQTARSGVAFAMWKAMRAEGVDWGADYRGAVRYALTDLLEGRMDQLIKQQLERMIDVGQGRPPYGC